MTLRTLRTVAHALMVHARVPEVYVHFALMYTTYHIFPVLPIKDLINEDGNPTTPHKLATGTKPSVSHLRVLFFPCVVCKATAHVETKTLNMRHQAQKGFRGIFIGILEHQKRISRVRTQYKKCNIFIRCCIWRKHFYCVIIYVTTLFRSDGDASGSDVYSLCYDL